MQQKISLECKPIKEEEKGNISSALTKDRRKCLNSFGFHISLGRLSALNHNIRILQVDRQI